MYQPPSTGQEVSAHIEALSFVRSTPGWQLYQAFLDMQEKTLVDALFTTRTPHELALVTGSLKSVRDMRTWVDRQLIALTNSVQAPDTNSETL